MSDDEAKKKVMEIIETHGGSRCWNSLKALDAVISARGFLFTAKHRPILNRVRVRAYAHEPRFAFYDFPVSGQTAELIGNDEARITDAEGGIASRARPREAFRGLRRQLYWDSLDFIYFGGYATWNYLTTPFLFLREGFQFKMLDPIPGSHLRLKATFPEDIPTHCREQVFYFDERLRLTRLDYTAEVVGRWAHAAHLCEGYRAFGNIKAPTRRRVFPLLVGNRPLPGPTLVAIDIHDIQAVAGA